MFPNIFKVIQLGNLFYYFFVSISRNRHLGLLVARLRFHFKARHSYIMYIPAMPSDVLLSYYFIITCFEWSRMSSMGFIWILLEKLFEFQPQNQGVLFEQVLAAQELLWSMCLCSKRAFMTLSLTDRQSGDVLNGSMLLKKMMTVPRRGLGHFSEVTWDGWIPCPVSLPQTPSLQSQTAWFGFRRERMAVFFLI